MAIGSDPMGLSTKPTAGMSGMFGKKEPEEKPVEEKQEVVVEEPQDQIYTYLHSIGGPSKEVIDRWKAEHGQVHLFPLDDQTVFIYRPLKRLEWNQMKIQFAQAGENLTEDQKKDSIVSKCLLWPHVDASHFSLMEAGLIDTLYEAISISSYFLAPQMIMNMVMRL